MAAEGYRIIDEPTPGGLATVVVSPIWPLFAVMFAGSWLAWPWAALNGFAMGSPNRMWELGLAVVGFVGNAVIWMVLAVMIDGELLPEGAFSYLYVGVIVWRLGISYQIYEWQNQAFGLYEYFGGGVRNGIYVVVLGFFARPLIVEVPLLLVLVG